MRCNRLAVTLGLVGLLTIAGGATAAQVQAGPWTLVTDGSGGIVTMSYPNPPTKLGIVQMLEVDLGANATAKQGRLTLKDGLKRDMSKEEVGFYYTLLDGPAAAWDYLASKDRVNKYSPASTPLPAHLAGSFVRVIIQNGINFFGKLAFESARPGGFVIAVDRSSGGPIQIENKIVREVQVAK